MRAFVASLLIAALIAASASASVKKIEKRGTIGGHGYSHGIDTPLGVASGVSLGSLETSAKYLPPIADVKTSFVPSVPSASYGLPPVASVSVPAPTYGVPAAVSHHPVPVAVPSYSAPVAAAIPSFSAPAHVPPVSVPVPVPVPATTYGVPRHSVSVLPSHPAPVYGAPASSVSLSVPHSLSVGHSLSHGIGPSTVVESVPSVGVALSKTYAAPSGRGFSLGHLSVPSKSYGVPFFASGRGLSLGHLSVPSSSYGVPNHFGHGNGFTSGLSLESVGPVGPVASSLSVAPSLSYGVPSVAVGSSDGYSYPVPAKPFLH